MIRRITLAMSLLAAASAIAAPRAVTVDDMARLRTVEDPQLSPDGAWITYTVQSSNVAKDERSTDLWLAPWQGVSERQLTYTQESESRPRWSPDGRWIAFLSARQDAKEHDQLWILPMQGGEAEKVTSLPGAVEDFAIAPDGQRIALVVADPVDDAPFVADTKTAKPIVVDRFYFKEDITGYLGTQRRHVYLLDLRTREVKLLTPGNHDEVLPSWSPDGAQLAFVSKRSPDPDRDDLFSIFVMEPAAGATPRKVATYQGEGGDTDWATAPQWSPDGRRIAYVAGGDPKLLYYAQFGLAVVDVASGEVRELTRSLDRNVSEPRWTRDGRALVALIEDDREVQLLQVDVATGANRRLTRGLHELSAVTSARDGRIAVLHTAPHHPNEVVAVERGTLRALTRQNAAWLAELQLASVEGVDAVSRDGTRIGGFVVKPQGFAAGKRYPTILRIHGGPTSQYSYSFMLDWQLLAAQGYLVLAANPRGSTGRGEAFTKAIFADWGNLDTQDVIAHVDRAIAAGMADPERLGVGGWSYGGILTNYVIMQDSRFKAAVSGASISNALAGYGTDMYIREYETELGPPWKNVEGWLKISSPFLKADRIKTPTLFICGSDDFNVPLLNSEQMYQALRSQNIPTQLVIYPGQYHGLTKPSYLKDRLQRYLDWYGRYLKP